eukprot:jgi/Mesvir1/21494/Mv03941-RA.1
MCGLSIFFHEQHKAMVSKGGDPEKSALSIVDMLAPGLEKLGHYKEAREYRGPEFAANNKRLMLENQQVSEAPRIKSCESNKLDMRAIKESSAKPVPSRVYAIVNNAANKLVTGYEQTADYRKDQGLTKKSQATRDTFTDPMCALTEFFHLRHQEEVFAGKDPEKTALVMVEALAPGLEKLGHYNKAREYRGPEFAANNKRLMLENQAWNRDKRMKS